MRSTGHDGEVQERRSTSWWVGAAVTGLLMLGALWLYTLSGLLAPLWAVVVLLTAWVVLAVVAVVVHRRRGAWSVLVPVLALGLWFAFLTLGGSLLGWTA